jgi:hypothetical protein
MRNRFGTEWCHRECWGCGCERTGDRAYAPTHDRRTMILAYDDATTVHPPSMLLSPRSSGIAVAEDRMRIESHTFNDGVGIPDL